MCHYLMAFFNQSQHVSAVNPVGIADGDCREDLLTDGADTCGDRVVLEVVADGSVHPVGGEAQPEHKKDDPEAP